MATIKAVAGEVSRRQDMLELADKIAAVKLDQLHSTWPTVSLPRVSETERELIVSVLRRLSAPAGNDEVRDALAVQEMLYPRRLEQEHKRYLDASRRADQYRKERNTWKTAAQAEAEFGKQWMERATVAEASLTLLDTQAREVGEPRRYPVTASGPTAFIDARLTDLAEANALYGKDHRLGAPDKIARNDREISWLKDVRSIIVTGDAAQGSIDCDTIATLTRQVLSYQEQLDDKAELREAIVMAENRLEAALIGDDVCKDCVELARSYLTDALAGSVALPSTNCGGGK